MDYMFLIWEGPAPLIADSKCTTNSFDAMDEWLTAVELDCSAASTTTISSVSFAWKRRA